jgi:hypothetical protein
MPGSAQSAPTKNTGSFASFLASFTGAADKQKDDWDLSELAEDVATISYEDAVRAYRPARSSRFAAPELPKNSSPAFPDSPISAQVTPGKKKRKNASITLRLTETEQAQLHERAAAAGLSVSAYTRSCIFEAESLRTQVKDALAQMHAASRPAPQTGSDEKLTPRRFFPRWPFRRDRREPERLTADL